MARTRIRQACRDDDPELRRMLRDTPMDGSIELRLLYEPSFFDAVEVQGALVDVMVAEKDDGRIVGMGCRAEKQVYINGKEETIGYLGGLRGEPEVRKGTLLARAYRHLKERHESGNATIYLTTIIGDNEVAMSVLTSGRAGLPTYEPCGCFHTLVLGMKRRKAGLNGASLVVRRARSDDLPSIVEFLSRGGERRQFFPCYTRSLFESKTGQLRDLEVEDLLVAEENGRIIGTLALWDQERFKQSKISSYRGLLKWIRIPLNVFIRMAARPALPPPGTTLHYITLSLLSVEGDRPEVFESLYRMAIEACADRDDVDHAVIGLHDRDPLLPYARKQPHFDYQAQLFVVHWENGADTFQSLDDRPPYVELGAL